MNLVLFSDQMTATTVLLGEAFNLSGNHFSILIDFKRNVFQNTNQLAGAIGFLGLYVSCDIEKECEHHLLHGQNSPILSVHF